MSDKTLEALRKEILPKIEEELRTRDEARKKCAAFERALSEQRRQIEKLGEEITVLSSKVEEAMSSGGDFRSIQKEIVEKKMEQADCEEWIKRIKNKSIPDARLILTKTESELKQAAIRALEPVRNDFEQNMDAKIEEAMNILDSYITGINSFYSELKLSATAGTAREFPKLRKANERLNLYIKNVLGR